MDRSTILILEDYVGRIEAFERAVERLGAKLNLRVWRDAPTMLLECASYFDDTCLISLDHDLVPESNESPDPGTGLEVAEYISSHEKFCPVIIHTTNHERRWSMHNAFRFAGWQVEIVPPLEGDWIENSWFRRAASLIAAEQSSSQQTSGDNR